MHCTFHFMDLRCSRPSLNPKPHGNKSNVAILSDWHHTNQDLLTVPLQINALQAQNQRLMAHVGEVEAHKGMLTGQVTTLRSRWSNATNDNMRLQAEVGTLRKTLQVCFARLAADWTATSLPIELLQAIWPLCARPVKKWSRCNYNPWQDFQQKQHCQKAFLSQFVCPALQCL